MGLRHVFFILFLPLIPVPIAMANTCISDRNKDHRPRVSCVAMSLSSVPSEIDVNTEVLVFSQNEFKTLDWSAYVGFQILHELDLSQNKITKLDGTGLMAKLSVLRLSNNLLTEVGESAFVSAPQLREVYLRNNTLRALHGGSFAGLAILEMIDLSHNLLTSLPSDLLSQVSSTSLKMLDLEGNRLLVMPNLWFDSKPELPYVFLSKNPWRCFCDIGYLQVYLDDQAHNVYVHTKPDSPDPLKDIENNAESVVCATPPSLANRPIIDLTEEEYCDPLLPSEAPAPPIGDADRETTPMTTSTVTPFTIPSATTRPVTTPYTTTKQATTITTTAAMAPTTAATSHSSTIRDTTTSSPATTALVTTSTVGWYALTTPFEVLASTLKGGVLMWTMRWVESWTVQHMWTQSWTAREEDSVTWSSVMNWSIFTEARGHQGVTTPDQTTTQSTTLLPNPTIRSSTRAPTTTPPQPTISTLTTTPSATTSLLTLFPGMTVVSGSRSERAGARVWCTWLFAGLLLLCVLSGLSCCLLTLGLVRAYLSLYLPLARKVSSSGKKNEAQAPLLGNFGKTDMDGGGYGPKMAPVSLSTAEQLTFRSVLFISKESRKEEEEVDRKEVDKPEKVIKNEGDGVGLATEETDVEVPGGMDAGITVVRLRNEKDKGVREGGEENKEVFRKTLYRVFSREEEIEGWREVEEHWEGEQGMRKGRVDNSNQKRLSLVGGARGDRKTRYSLILREEMEGERETQERGMEWLVGEWEMGGIERVVDKGDFASLMSEVGENKSALEDFFPVDKV